MNKLYIVATPIGNMEDITIRALKILFESDFIACEDTRRTGQLLKILNEQYSIFNKQNKKKVNQKLISFYDEVETYKTSEIIDLIHDGKKVSLVSDGGTPLISDPGYKLVSECIKNNIRIESIPGPTALISALVSSGLPPGQFLFLGFPPQKSRARLRLFTDLKDIFEKSSIYPTIILFESPHRIYKTLEDLKYTVGDIEVVIARELTKLHEEIIRDKISNILSRSPNLKGEITIIFST